MRQSIVRMQTKKGEFITIALGSTADLQANNSPTAASEGKAAPQ
jgi:hypothetical protein